MNSKQANKLLSSKGSGNVNSELPGTTLANFINEKLDEYSRSRGRMNPPPYLFLTTKQREDLSKAFFANAAKGSFCFDAAGILSKHRGMDIVIVSNKIAPFIKRDKTYTPKEY